MKWGKKLADDKNATCKTCGRVCATAYSLRGHMKSANGCKIHLEGLRRKEASSAFGEANATDSTDSSAKPTPKQNERECRSYLAYNTNTSENIRYSHRTNKWKAGLPPHPCYSALIEHVV